MKLTSNNVYIGLSSSFLEKLRENIKKLEDADKKEDQDDLPCPDYIAYKPPLALVKHVQS